MANRPARWVVFFRVVFLVAVATCFACEGGGAPDGQPPGETVAARLTTGRTATDEQARASAYADSAARYRRLSAENKQAVADLTRTTAPVPVRAKRQAAADLADRLAAASQKVADFHTQRAAEKAALASGEVRQ